MNKKAFEKNFTGKAIYTAAVVFLVGAIVILLGKSFLVKAEEVLEGYGCKGF